MEIGKVPENVLKRAVFKQIKHLRPEVLLHPGVGEDCSAIETAEDEVLVFSTDPITGASKGMGTLAYSDLCDPASAYQREEVA